MGSLGSAPSGGRRKVVRALAATLVALTSVGALAAPVSAARPVSLNVTVGDYCFDGYARKDSFLKIVVRDSLNRLKGRSAVIADSVGGWYGCTDFGVIETGDKIRVTVFETGQRLLFTVPKLTVDANRSTDVVSGRGPAGKKVTVEVSDYSNSIFGGYPYDETRKLNVSGGGSYSHDFSTDGIDLLGGAEVLVDYSAQAGLVHVVRRMTVPYLYVQIGDSHFGGAARPNKHVGLTLTLGGGEVATGDAVADFVSSGFDGLFVDADGDTYKIVGGEHIASTGIAGDASFTIPAINAQVALASDKISGTCFANELVGVAVIGPGYFAYGVKYKTAAADGSFSIDMTNMVNVKRGASVYVACFRPGGDIVEQDLVAK